MSFGNQHRIKWTDITEEDLPDVVSFGSDLTMLEKSWITDGISYLPGILPTNLIQQYCRVRERLNDPRGWRSPTPYVHVREIRDICLFPPLMGALNHLVGEQVGLHLNLTGWVTTERDLHQDSYLNPSFVGTKYAAVWMALDDISPDCGPFQYVPGSHRWPVVRRDKVFQYLTEEEQRDPDWPEYTQRWIADACMSEILRREAPVYTYTPHKGDVLIWHPNLIHRGSPANKPGMERKALIAHYSALSVRSDMPERRVHDNGETYFYFPGELK